jgi:hypothetical protein
MDLQAALTYLTTKIHEAPLGSPQQSDYLARRRHVQELIRREAEPNPQDAA